MHGGLGRGRRDHLLDEDAMLDAPRWEGGGRREVTRSAISIFLKVAEEGSSLSLSSSFLELFKALLLLSRGCSPP